MGSLSHSKFGHDRRIGWVREPNYISRFHQTRGISAVFRPAGTNLYTDYQIEKLGVEGHRTAHYYVHPLTSYLVLMGEGV